MKTPDINGKTPEEIKKGIANAVHVKYLSWPDENTGERRTLYGVAIGYVLRDEIFAYIQQLESRLAQAERERDAAVADLEDSADCEYCEHDLIFHTCLETNCHACERDCPCARCSLRQKNGFKWRGICPENTKEVES